MDPMETLVMNSSLTIDGGIIISLTMLMALAVYVIYTAILYYHWQQYSSSKRVTYLTLLTYAVMTLPLMGVLLLAGLTL